MEAWVAGPPLVILNGRAVTGLLPPEPAAGWIALRRGWRPGDRLEVTLPMRLAFAPAPDHPAVQAVTYGPVVLSGVYPADPGPLTPPLQLTSLQRAAGPRLAFDADSGRQPVRLIPVSRAAHQYYAVYWQAR